MNNLLNKYKEKLSARWQDAKEDSHYLAVILVCIIVIGVVFYFLYSQTNRLHFIKQDNIALMESNNALQAEISSLKAQLQFNASPVITEENKPLDVVIQSNTQEIKGKVAEIQQQLIDGGNAQVPAHSPVKQHSDVRELNNSLQQSFCSSNPTHQTCKEIR